MFLLSFAGALRRSELVGLDVEHVTWTGDGLKLRIERSKALRGNKCFKAVVG
jgi:integrase